MTEIEVDELKKLEQLCYKRKRIFYALAKASKFKFYPKSVIDSIVSEFLIWFTLANIKCYWYIQILEIHSDLLSDWYFYLSMIVC